MTYLKMKITCSAAALGLAVAISPLGTTRAEAGTDAYIGELMLVGYNFCPRATLEAAGQLLAISQNTALFSLLGTTFGGDGRTTFGLPDLRGRTAIGYGAGPGLGNYSWGQRGGAESFTMATQQMPSHNHMVNAVGEGGDKGGPGNDYLSIVAPVPADPNATKYSAYHDGPPDRQMDPGMVSNNGGSQPVTHRGPYLAMKWCIVTQGIFPSRN
ncbi:phage tail protein [Marimonas arenosa]|uniref:Tail fiber protein n=1 Tax=Marimonas arenosa TaxID=1795305 RepID=A0AAE4B2I7_9RHOB|nr:tail fiber protein [Marimonas arenosa]MDQ2088327.1 tail fiber protein [Marimonas arenosa]